MLIIGLTGSIATGKSTVSNILRSPPHNLPIIDADVIARQVVEPGTPGYNAILSHFSSSTPDLLEDAPPPPSDGASTSSTSAINPSRPINRQALGRRVFGQGTDAERKVLNGIVHPAVRAEMRRQILSAHVRGHWAVVLDVPLLFESGIDLLCGTVMVVGVTDPKEQIRRLRARDPHLSEGEADDRVKAQWDVRDKARRAEKRGPGRGYVVWNDGDRIDLQGRVVKVLEDVRARSPRWWTMLLWINPGMAAWSAVWSVVLSWWAKRSWDRMKANEKAKL